MRRAPAASPVVHLCVRLSADSERATQCHWCIDGDRQCPAACMAAQVGVLAGGSLTHSVGAAEVHSHQLSAATAKNCPESVTVGCASNTHPLAAPGSTHSQTPKRTLRLPSRQASYEPPASRLPKQTVPQSAASINECHRRHDAPRAEVRAVCPKTGRAAILAV